MKEGVGDEGPDPRPRATGEQDVRVDHPDRNEGKRQQELDRGVAPEHVFPQDMHREQDGDGRHQHRGQIEHPLASGGRGKSWVDVHGHQSSGGARFIKGAAKKPPPLVPAIDLPVPHGPGEPWSRRRTRSSGTLRAI